MKRLLIAGLLALACVSGARADFTEDGTFSPDTLGVDGDTLYSNQATLIARTGKCPSVRIFL